MFPRPNTEDPTPSDTALAFLRAPACPLCLSCAHAHDAPILVECNPRPSPGSVAESLSSMAHRNLHRRENDPDRLPGILGIHVARATRTLAVSEVDRGDGTVCPSEAEEFVTQFSVPGSQFSVNADELSAASLASASTVKSCLTDVRD